MFRARGSDYHFPDDCPAHRPSAAGRGRLSPPRPLAADAGASPAVAVLGGTGFIGRPLVQALRQDGRRLRLLVRARSADGADADVPDLTDLTGLAGLDVACDVVADATDVADVVGAGPGADVAAASIVELRGDLDDRDSLARLIVPGCNVINLAWAGAGAERAVSQARALADACVAGGARMLLHCSSVEVMAGCDDARLDDRTPPRPRSAYGAAKLAGEEALRQTLAGRVPLVIVRPTSVFGPGGASLMRLAGSLARGARLPNYLRSCLFDRRLLHLVPVETVVAALRFLEAREPAAGAETRVCLVSADDESPSRFREIEARLMSGLRVSDYAWPRLPLPPALLRLTLRAAGKRSSLPFTVVDARHLREQGFRAPVTMAAAVDAFAAWFAGQHHVSR